MELDLFKHQLCIDFQELYELDKEEADRFNEAWCHFHKHMTDINNQPLRNALWLQENFMDLWNEMSPKEMLKVCITHSMQDFINTSKQRERQNNV